VTTNITTTQIKALLFKAETTAICKNTAIIINSRIINELRACNELLLQPMVLPIIRAVINQCHIIHGSRVSLLCKHWFWGSEIIT